MATVESRITQAMFTCVAFALGCGQPDASDSSSGPSDSASSTASTITCGKSMDRDGDGYLKRDLSSCTEPERAQIEQSPDLAEDCDDTDPDRFQSAWFYQDADRDTHGVENANAIIGCRSEWKPGYSLVSDDDNDNNPKVIQLDPNDRDGDGVPSAKDCDDNDPARYLPEYYYRDADGDGFGTNSEASVRHCQGDVVPGYVENYQDCDDTNPNLNELKYPDRDGDGHGSGGSESRACVNSKAPGYSPWNGDCDDTNATIFPHSRGEIPFNGIDETCEGNDFVESYFSRPEVPATVAVDPTCTTVDFALYGYIYGSADWPTAEFSDYFVAVVNRGQQALPAGARVVVGWADRATQTITMDQPLPSRVSRTVQATTTSFPDRSTVTLEVPDGVVDCNLNNNSGSVRLYWEIYF